MDTVLTATGQLMDYTEPVLRQRIAEIPDSIDSLMANTRNNPLEDFAVHLPMLCDRYELCDDMMPGARRFRGGIGVVKKQRILADGFITHECDRHEDVRWGIFGGGEGQCGAVEIYNAARPDDITDMPAKFTVLKGFGSPAAT